MSPIRKISPKVINRTPVRSPDTTSPTSPGSSLRPRVINFSALPTQNNQSSPEKLQPAKKRLHYPDMYTIDFGEEIKKSVASTPPFRNHSDLDFFDNDDREAGRSFDVVNVGLKYPVRPRRNLDNAVQYPIPDEIDFEGSPQSERKPVVYQIENPNKLKPQKEQPTQAVSALWRQKRSPTKTVQVTTVKPMGFSQISKGNAYSPEKNLFETLSAKLREQEHLRNELEKIQQSFEQNANDDYTLPVSPKVRSRTPNKAEVERKKHHNSITSISSPEPLVIDTSVLGEKKPQQPQTTPKLLDSSINISINTPTPSRSMTVTNTEISIQLSDIEMEEDELMIADDFDRILNKSRESNKSIIEEEPIAPIQQQIRTSHENDLALMRQNQLEGMSVFVLRSPEKPKSRPQQSEKNSIIIIPEEVEDDIIEEKQNVISYIDNLRARELQELEIQRTEQILLLEIEKERLAKEKLEQHNELLRLHQLEIEREKEELALREQQLFEQKKKLELERVRREDALRKQIEEERLLDQQKLELERQKNLLTQQREIEEKKLEEERKDTEYQIQEERERFRLEMEKFDQMRREIEEEKEKIEEIRSIRKLEHDRFLKLQSDELERMRKERQREENLLLKQKKNLIALQDAVSPAFSRSTLALSSHSFTEVPSFSIPEPSTPLTKGEPLLTPHSIRSMMITDNVDIDQNHSPSPLSTPSPNTKDEKRRSPLRSDGHNETMSTYSPLVPQVVKHDEKAHNQSYLSNSKEVIQEHEKYVQESPIILFSPPVSNLRAMNESRLQESPYIEASLRYDSQSNSPNRSAVLVKGNWDIAHTGEPTPQKEEARFDSGVSTVEEFLNNSIDLQDMLIQPDFSDIDSINLSDADISEGEEEIALKTEPEKVVQREAYSTFGDHQVREIKTDINDTQDKKQKPSDNQQDNQLERYEIKQGEGGMTKETEFVHTQKTQSEVIQIEEKIKQEIANPSSTQPTSPLVSPMTPLTPMTPATLVKTDSPYSEVRVKEITKQNMWTINYMRRGTTFTKIHKKNNKSNNRIVKLDSTCTHLIFQKTGAALFNKTQKVAVADIQWLVYGPHTALFEKSASNCPWRCFSFITTKRSYDLMAGNDVDVDVWILGLQSLIHRRIIKWNRPLYTRGQLLFKRMKLKLQLRAWTERKPLHKVICERIAIAYNTLDQVEDQQLFVKRSSEVVGTPLKSSSQRVIMAPTTPQQTGQSTIEQLQDSPMTASKQRLERLRLDLSRLPPPQENLD